MIKLFRVQLSMLVFISLLGGVVTYEVLGSLSGSDAIGLAGLVTGFLIGLFSGKHFGMFSIIPSFLSALTASILLIFLALFSMDSEDSLIVIFGQFAIGFSVLSGTVIGCHWGGHLLIREEDLEQLREAFGEQSGDAKYSKNDSDTQDD